MNWEQLQTILWLRWQLTRNQWTRSKGVGAVIAAVIAGMLLLAGMAGFAGALAGGIFGLGKARPLIVWIVWLSITVGFLFFWMVGVLQELQRSESIDIQRLLHLPVGLGQIFLVNYAASHLTPGIVLFIPAMFGLTLGLTISRGPAMALMGPLAISMVFMVSAWTYCLRGWLAGMMSNPRKRRNVTMIVAFSFILLSQGPNIYFNVLRPTMGAKVRNASNQINYDQRMLDRLTAAQKFIPPLWVPLGARGLVDGNPLPALAGTAGCLALGALGLRRAYRSTLRFYRGETGSVRVKNRKEQSGVAGAAKPVRTLLDWRIPVVPEQAGALALATFQSLIRAPEVRMAWGTSIAVTLIGGISLAFRTMPKMPEVAQPFIATAASCFSVFLLVQFFANQFGFDRDGFRALILSPTDRKLILLGKNLACLPVGGVFGGALLLIVTLRLHLSPYIFMAGVLQLLTLLLLAGLGGNLLSILVPFRIQPGTMKPTKMPGLTMLVMAVCHMLFPIVMAPAFLPALAALIWRKLNWPAAPQIDLIFSVPVLGLAALAYWMSLDSLGRLLQRRETRILSVVTVEVE